VFSLTTTDVVSGGLNGGYEMTIAGTGFPEHPNKITFTLCSQQCTVTSIDNIQAKIKVP